MAFTAIDSNDIDVGDPVKKELWDRTKDNFDDHESRINLLEAGANKIVIFNTIVRNAANFIASTSLAGFGFHFAEADFTLVAAEVSIIDDGSSGILQIDLLKSSTLGGAFTSLFNTKPSLTAGGGDDRTSTNADFATTSVSQNDWLRLDVTSLMVDNRSFHVRIFGEVS